MSVFLEITKDDAELYLGTIKDSKVDVIRKYMDGDHFQDGQGWIGPIARSTETGLQMIDTMGEIQKAFTFKNIIAEIVSRQKTAYVGKEPSWGFTVKRTLKSIAQPDGTNAQEQPAIEEQTLIDEANEAMTAWWNVRGIHSILNEAALTLESEGRMIFRIFLSDSAIKLPSGDTPQDKLVAELERIYIDAAPDLDPQSALVYIDPQTKEKVGIIQFQMYDREAVAHTFIEVCFLTDQAITINRQFDEGGNSQEQAFEIAGRLLVYELNVQRLVTPSIINNQKQHSLAKTMETRNVTVAGWRDVIITNSLLGQTTDPAGEDQQAGFYPEVFIRGPSTVVSLQGVETTDEMGGKRVATPTYQTVEPVNPEYIQATQNKAYEDILGECDQKHVLIQGDSQTSGISRQQARADFEQRAKPSAGEMNPAGRWLLETVLAVAAFRAGRKNAFEELKATFECKIYTGPITPAESAEARLLVKDEVWARERAMIFTGVDDPDAEENVIAEDNAVPRAMQQAQLVASQRFNTALGSTDVPPNPKQPPVPPVPPVV